MPSQTVYFDQVTYEFAQETADKNQSVGQRLSELAEKGMEAEAKTTTK